jgi:hypothetical protein
VISRSGWSGEVEDLDGNRVHVYAQSETTYGEAAGLFGINCGHYAIPFIPGYSKARQPEQNEQENAKEYQESQQQRALERKLREEKRDLSVLKAQGASDDEIKAQRERVRVARNNLDDFCEETGRARRTGREGTGADATWPGKNGPVRRFNDQYVSVNDTLHVTPVNGFTSQALAVVPSAPAVPAVPSVPAVNEIKAVSSVAEAKDFSQLSDYLQKQYNITVNDDVKELSFEPVREAMKGFESMAKQYPEIGDTVKIVNTNSSDVMGCTGKKITFNPSYFNTSEKLTAVCKRNADSGWWPKNSSPFGIGVHESAHALEAALIQLSGKYPSMYDTIKAWNSCTEAKAIVSEAVKAVKNTAAGKGKLKAELIKAVSKYANENASETMAECFQDYAVNGSNANILSKKVVEISRKFYNSYKGVSEK